MSKYKTIGQCNYQLLRAKQALSRAAKKGDSAAYERASDAVGKWEVELRIARGQSDNAAMEAVFGAPKR